MILSAAPQGHLQGPEALRDRQVALSPAALLHCTVL